MLLDEDPATLIQVTLANFNTAPDRIAIQRINESVTSLQQARDLRMRDVHGVLKKLSRNVASLSQQFDDVAISRKSMDHASHIVELDNEKFRIAKAASDFENEGIRLEQEIEVLNSRIIQLDSQGVEGDDGARARREVEDPIVLKLKVYQSLGIDLERDSTGAYNRAIVRNSRLGDVNVLDISSEMSKYGWSSLLWQKMQ